MINVVSKKFLDKKLNCEKETKKIMFRKNQNNKYYTTKKM